MKGDCVISEGGFVGTRDHEGDRTSGCGQGGRGKLCETCETGRYFTAGEHKKVRMCVCVCVCVCVTVCVCDSVCASLSAVDDDVDTRLIAIIVGSVVPGLILLCLLVACIFRWNRRPPPLYDYGACASPLCLRAGGGDTWGGRVP